MYLVRLSQPSPLIPYILATSVSGSKIDANIVRFSFVSSTCRDVSDVDIYRINSTSIRFNEFQKIDEPIMTSPTIDS